MFNNEIQVAQQVRAAAHEKITSQAIIFVDNYACAVISRDTETTSNSETLLNLFTVNVMTHRIFYLHCRSDI